MKTSLRFPIIFLLFLFWSCDKNIVDYNESSLNVNGQNLSLDQMMILENDYDFKKYIELRQQVRIGHDNWVINLPKKELKAYQESLILFQQKGVRPKLDFFSTTDGRLLNDKSREILKRVSIKYSFLKNISYEQYMELLIKSVKKDKQKVARVENELCDQCIETCGQMSEQCSEQADGQFEYCLFYCELRREWHNGNTWCDADCGWHRNIAQVQCSMANDNCMQSCFSNECQ